MSRHARRRREYARRSAWHGRARLLRRTAAAFWADGGTDLLMSEVKRALLYGIARERVARGETMGPSPLRAAWSVWQAQRQLDAIHEIEWRRHMPTRADERED